MVSVDTNVLLRYLVRDDPVQVIAADELFSTLTTESPAFISREVTIELTWVLERSYRLSRGEVTSIVRQLAETDSIVLEAHEDVVACAFQYRDRAADFADLMILAAAQRSDASPLFTFDRRLARNEGATLLQVS